MLALVSLSLDSVDSRVSAVNLWFLNFLVDYLIFVFLCVYRSLSTDDRVYDRLSMAMGEIQSVDPLSLHFVLWVTSTYITRSDWAVVLPMPMRWPSLILSH